MRTIMFLFTFASDGYQWYWSAVTSLL
jgi:hypothetical protein